MFSSSLEKCFNFDDGKGRFFYLMFHILSKRLANEQWKIEQESSFRNDRSSTVGCLTRNAEMETFPLTEHFVDDNDNAHETGWAILRTIPD
jgi:hypothetical protein